MAKKHCNQQEENKVHVLKTEWIQKMDIKSVPKSCPPLIRDFKPENFDFDHWVQNIEILCFDLHNDACGHN